MHNLSRFEFSILRAQRMAKNLGTRAAAGYLRNRGVSLEAALWILLGR